MWLAPQRDDEFRLGAGAAGSTSGAGSSPEAMSGKGARRKHARERSTLQGIASAGANDPPDQTAYRDCMRRRGTLAGDSCHRGERSLLSPMLENQP